MSTSNRKKYFVFALFVIAALIIYTSQTLRKRNPSVEVPKVPIRHEMPNEIVATRPGVSSVPFALMQSSQVSRVSGHVHSPWGTKGEDSYEYDGQIEFGEHKADLKASTFAPYAVVQFNDRSFLILRHYFNHVDFDIMESNGSDPFQRIDIRKAPEEIADLNFRHKADAFNYRVWWICSLADRGEWKLVNSMLEIYLWENPRSFSLPEKDASDYMFRFGEFIQKAGAAPLDEKMVLSKNLRHIVAAITSNDDSEVLRFSLSAILRFDPSEGFAWVCEYKSNALRTFPANDSRIKAIEGSHILSVLVCDAPSSQPATPPR